jgi:hypothetical protein
MENSFQASSGNVCTLQRLPEAGLRASWSRPQSQTTAEDQEEFAAWLARVLKTGKPDGNPKPGFEMTVAEYRSLVRNRKP